MSGIVYLLYRGTLQKIFLSQDKALCEFVNLINSDWQLSCIHNFNLDLSQYRISLYDTNLQININDYFVVKNGDIRDKNNNLIIFNKAELLIKNQENHKIKIDDVKTINDKDVDDKLRQYTGYKKTFLLLKEDFSNGKISKIPELFADKYDLFEHLIERKLINLDMSVSGIELAGETKEFFKLEQHNKLIDELANYILLKENYQNKSLNDNQVVSTIKSMEEQKNINFDLTIDNIDKLREEFEIYKKLLNKKSYTPHNINYIKNNVINDNYDL